MHVLCYCEYVYVPLSYYIYVHIYVCVHYIGQVGSLNFLTSTAYNMRNALCPAGLAKYHRRPPVLPLTAAV